MTCYSKQILELFYNVQNTGRIIKPEAIGRAGSKAEGTVIEFSWRVRDGIIQDARFRTFGDVNAIAISSVLTTMMIGKTLDEVLSIRAEDILEHLFDAKPNYLYLTDLALSALGKTYENYEKRNIKIERRQSAISQKLKSDIEQIESGELDVELDNLDLSEISSLEKEEEDYLRNLSSYEKTIEENSLEKSLQKLYSYAQTSKTENSVTTSTSRGRGRPRKERTPEEIEAELNKVKRGRGRPKKERTPEELDTELNKVKRGRGRPRKDSLVAENELNYTQPATQTFNTTYVKEEPINNIFDTEEDEDDFGVDMFSNFSYNNKPKAKPVYNEDVIIEEEDVEDDGLYNENNKDIEDIEHVEEEINRPISSPSFNEERRGRGRPRKERTPEEIEAELNKEKRGRGRPKKERTPEEIEAELNTVKRGRGRPRKELTEEEALELSNKVKRGRGRPKKDTAIVIQSVKPVTEEKVVEEKPNAEQKEIEIESNLTNSFAPANNKYTIGKSTMPYYTNTTTTTYKKVETKTNFYTNIKETYNVVSEENSLGGGKAVEEKPDTIKVESNIVEPKKVELESNVKELLEDDQEPENVQPLSENVNNILQHGGSIEDALKFLLDN